MATKPARFKLLPRDYDPGRRLIAAVALRAVDDCLYPPKNLSQRARRNAEDFLLTDGLEILFKLGIPISKIQQRINGKAIGRGGQGVSDGR